MLMSSISTQVEFLALAMVEEMPSFLTFHWQKIHGFNPVPKQIIIRLNKQLQNLI